MPWLMKVWAQALPQTSMQPVPCLPFDVSFDLKATRLLRAHEMTRRAKGDVQHY